VAIKSGFFNSVSGDRKYDADDMNTFFDGVITEGVFELIENGLEVIPSSGLQIAVKSGKAWFLVSWIYNNSDAFLTLSDADLTYDRIDIIALDFDKSDLVRENDIIIVEGTPAASPVPPTLIDTATHLQIPLAHILVESNETEILVGDITDKRGTVDCPWVTTAVDLIVSVDNVTIEIVADELTVKDDGITQSKIGPLAVDTPELAADAVTGDKIEDDAIDSEHYAPDSIDSEHYAPGSVDSAAIGNDQVDSQHYNADSIDSEHYAPGSVDSAAIGNDQVDSQHYAPGSVNSAAIGNDQVDSQHYNGGSIDHEHLATNIVDDDNIGNRVPMLTRRQGGHATNWGATGNTNYTPTAVKMQAGSKSIGIVNPGASTSVDITFPQAFSGTPIVIVTVEEPGGSKIIAGCLNPTATTAPVWAYNFDTSTHITQVFWLAIGPE
jgi:hypothetical protein